MSSFILYLTGSVPSVARGSSRRDNSRKVRFSSSTPRVPSSRSVSRSGFAQELSEMVDQSKRMRLDYLIQQAKDALKFAVKNGPVTFPCACIAGDVVILHLLHELGYLKTGEVKVVLIDTLHLFPETLDFFREKELAYGFKGVVYMPEGCTSKADFDKSYGYDLWKKDIELYDKVAKVEPFQRSLRETQCRAMITGRRKDQGFERAFIEIYEEGKADVLCNVQPLAYWSFQECFDYLDTHSIPVHPLHEKGYPSVGDSKDTIPVDRDRWFEYAGERSGRFQGITTAGGKKKTECGMHVDDGDDERVFDRDLWDKNSMVEKLTERATVEDLLVNNLQLEEPGKLMVIYAPWCKYCMAAEEVFEAFAESAPGVAVAYRGDIDREFVSKLGVQSFPTFLYFPGGGNEPVKFEGAEEDRTPENFLQFHNTMDWFHKGSPNVFR